MPSYGEYSPKCAICGRRSKQWTLLSTTFGGAPGLDCRPAELHEPHVERCPHCGYCAPRIENGEHTLQDVVNSESYRSRLTNPDFPEEANSHLCWSFINGNQGDLVGAAFACLEAAWACDDVSLAEGARNCRLKAVAMFEKAREEGLSFSSQVGAEEALLADLLRRSGDFGRALDYCAAGLKRSPGRIIAAVLRLEETLIARHDIAHHTVGELAIGLDDTI
ncbi:MAG: hypothetical protein QUS33_09710 [Dehalococcoidia bacterium]|nr:hypothetical protein [Dehalococcoidia bacterium]